MKCLPKKFDRIVQIGDKNWSLVPQNVHLVPKDGNICTFYTKNDVFAQTFDPILQIGDKNWSLVPQNVHLVLRNGKICTFYTKNEVFAQKFDPIVQIGEKTGVWYPKMYIWSLKWKNLYFLH